MIKVQLLTPTAKPPIKVDPAAVGWDVFADSVECKDGMLIYKCGIVVEPPEGYYFGMYPRSSQSSKECVFGNSVGIIEPQYRGELQVRLRPVGNFKVPTTTNSNHYAYMEYKDWQFLPFKLGDRIAQLVLHPLVNSEIEIVEKLSETARGSSGFGGFTGK